jgi:hypothetical protein
MRPTQWKVLLGEERNRLCVASPFHILALASVIDKPIYSVYPDIPTAARIKQALHFLFYTRRMLTANSNRIFENPRDIFFPIMWSKMHRTSLHGWEPNHFVSLVTRSEFIQKYSNSSVSYSSAVKIKRATRGPKPFIPSKRVKKNSKNIATGKSVYCEPELQIPILHHYHHHWVTTKAVAWHMRVIL